MTQQLTAEDQVLDTMRAGPICDLEDVAHRCPTLTWNQVSCG